jgi:CobQ-like glutamine amidotransferase family enzyme
MRRSVITPTATIGIRGTGVYLEATPEVSYFCTCFGATEITSTPTGAMMESVAVATENHQARTIHRDATMGMRIARAGFERHTNEEMARLESLVGRPNPFRS